MWSRLCTPVISVSAGIFIYALQVALTLEHIDERTLTTSLAIRIALLQAGTCPIVICLFHRAKQSVAPWCQDSMKNRCDLLHPSYTSCRNNTKSLPSLLSSANLPKCNPLLMWRAHESHATMPSIRELPSSPPTADVDDLWSVHCSRYAALHLLCIFTIIPMFVSSAYVRTLPLQGYAISIVGMLRLTSETIPRVDYSSLEQPCILCCARGMALRKVSESRGYTRLAVLGNF